MYYRKLRSFIKLKDSIIRAPILQYPNPSKRHIVYIEASELPSTPSASINMLSVSNTGGPAFNTRSQNQQCLAPDSSTTQPSVTPDVMSTPDLTPKSLTADR